MANKKAQDNKKKTYLEFLQEAEGIIPLGFRFDREPLTHSFHFDLMSARIGLVLFDCVGEKAVACVSKGDTDKCREIAKSLGGDEFSVTFML